MPQVMTGDDMARVIRRMSHEILEAHDRVEGVVLIGIHTRGVILARDLAMTIDSLAGILVPVGELDIGLYRDDRGVRSDIPVRATVMPVDITDRHVVIVDDVLYTGRTVRAAMDALSDLGRALTMELAVLVDRGHRELPIRADFVGRNLPTARDEVVRVRLPETDDREGVWIERIEAA